MVSSTITPETAKLFDVLKALIVPSGLEPKPPLNLSSKHSKSHPQDLKHKLKA